MQSTNRWVFPANQGDVVTEELRNEKWEQDVENKLTLTKTQNLDIVLVPDYSSSLGNDIVSVKNYAINFINSIRDQNSGAKVGIGNERWDFCSSTQYK